MKRIVLILMLVLPLWCWANDTIVGKVVSVYDGDTFTLLTEKKEQVKVRLYGIDAPESSGQPYWKKSRDYLASMVAAKEVTIDVRGKDKYGRTIGVVSTDSIADVNLEMLKAGYAWHYSYFDHTKAYSDAFLDAMAAKKGLWAMPGAINPYEWRQGRRE